MDCFWGFGNTSKFTVSRVGYLVNKRVCVLLMFELCFVAKDLLNVWWLFVVTGDVMF